MRPVGSEIAVNRSQIVRVGSGSLVEQYGVEEVTTGEIHAERCAGVLEIAPAPGCASLCESSGECDVLLLAVGCVSRCSASAVCAIPTLDP